MTDVSDHLDDLRVILVGQTGLDSGLRSDPSVELVRARTPVDAIGELADPLDAAHPGRAVVIVDPGAEPRGGGASGRVGDLSEFLAGLRRVDPEVRVLYLARNGEATPSGYDGRIGPTTDAAALRAFLADGTGANGEHAQRVPETAQRAAEVPPCETLTPSESIEPKLAPARGSRAAAFQTGHELGLLRTVTAGRAVLAAAMDHLRAQDGFGDVRYADGAEAGSGGVPRSTAPVRVAGTVCGALCSDTLAPAALAPAAEWLGAWLGLEHEQARLRELAFRDPLTGAWNRRFFDDFLPTAIDEARRHRRALTLMVFDIDDFKRFNDQHGHAAGDEILTECVRLLDTAVRPTDKVCRIGGDEFAVIFYEPEGPRQPDSHHPTSVFDIAERFQLLLREARFSKLGDDAPGHLTVSGGLATFPWDGACAESLLERADQLALEGKRLGKNVIAFGPGCRRLGGE